MRQVNSYLSFDGNCREVMTFYNECLDGELMITTVAESTIASQLPPAMQNHVMHSSIKKNGIVLDIRLWDMHRDKLVEGNNTTLCVNCDSDEH